MIRYLILLAALFPFFALAQQCPSKENLPDLCIAIGTQLPDASGEFRFAYERIVSEAACVDQADDDALRARKIGQMWQKFGDTLICNNVRFNVRDGNVLKWAVSARNVDFLFDAACVWQVDLNRIDSIDARTVLDYTFDEYMRHEDHPVGKTIKSYYDFLRFGCGGGRKTIVARHRAELCAAGGSMPEDCKYKNLMVPPCGTPGRPTKGVAPCSGPDDYEAMVATFEAFQAHRTQLLQRWMSGNMD